MKRLEEIPKSDFFKSFSLAAGMVLCNTLNKIEKTRETRNVALSIQKSTLRILFSVSNRIDRDDLMEQAFGYINTNELKKAAKIGNQLLKMKYTGGFEIMGLVYMEKGEINKAIKTLEEGVKKAPDIWLLWQLLGNAYSDNKKYKKALQSYSSALKCADKDVSSIYYNIAIALSREEKYEEALKACENVIREELLLMRICLKIFLLNKLNRFEESIDLGKRQIDTLESSEQDNTYISKIYSEMAIAYWAHDRDEINALKHIFKAIEHDKTNSDAMNILREVENNSSKTSKYSRIIIEGKANGLMIEDADALGFFATYGVVAENEEEALKYVRRFEPKEVRDTLRIEKCEVLKGRVIDPKGVYYCNDGYILFPLEGLV